MTIKNSAIAALAAVALLFSIGAAGATRERCLAARNAAKSGDGARLGASLAVLQKAAARRVPQSDVTRSVTRKLPALRASDGYVSISAYGDDLAGLRAQLVAKGLHRTPSLHPTAVSGRAPVAALGDMAATTGLKFLRPTLAMARAGIASSRRAIARCAPTWRGAKAAPTAAAFASACCPTATTARPARSKPGAPFTRAAQDIANGDLPRDVLVLKDLADAPSDDCSDEGRAMMQLIHDVAPGSPLAFYTAFESQEDFAAGIRALAAAGSKVIVDDIIYFAEPMFEDGIIAQAVDDVYRDGVAYFSSAGNDARQSYESRFRLSAEDRHFRPAPRLRAAAAAVDGLQSDDRSAGSATLLSVQWDQPSLSANGRRGAHSDIDVWFYDMNGEPIEICTDDPEQVVCQIPGFDANVGGDAVETPIMVNFSDEDIEVQIGIELFEGPHLTTSSTCGSISTRACSRSTNTTRASGTVYGHANAAGAEAVGAAAWYQTEEWGSPLRPQCFPACLNSFSSAGGAPVFFGAQRPAAARSRGAPQARRHRPGRRQYLVLPASTWTSKCREPPSRMASRTSSALRRRRRTSRPWPRSCSISAPATSPPVSASSGPRNLTPDLIYWALRLTADDMKLRNFGGDIGPQRVDNANGFDFDTGFGFVDAQRALRATRGF